MDNQAAVAFTTKLENDASLREEFRNDPIGVAERAGLQLSADDRAMAESFRGLSDPLLVERISKMPI